MTRAAESSPFEQFREPYWGGAAPRHWHARRLRFGIKLNPSKAEIRALDQELEVSFVPMEAVGEFGGLDLSSTKPLSAIGDGYTYFRDDDVVVAKITPCFENGKGALAVGLSNGTAFGTTELHVLRPREGIDPRFLFYLTLGHPFRDLGEATMYGAGGQKRVPEVFIRDLVHPIPSIELQRAIASLLDRKTAEIDALIAKKERLIELLEEKRTAAITQAVTKGIEPGVAMKESGVDWIGRVPSHWDLVPLKHLADFTNGVAFKPEDWGPEGIPIVRIENLNGSENFNFTHREVPERFHASAGDILFGWSGNRGTSFGPFRWMRPGLSYVNQHIFRVEPIGVEVDWLFWALRGVTHYIEQQAHGIIGMVHITRGELGKIQVPVPSRREMLEIAKYLDEESHARLALIDRVRRAIVHLYEYRSALITAAVTGQLEAPSTA